MFQIIELAQGTPAWHEHRAKHYNASDAAAMMGCSPYKTRTELVRQLATGIEQEFSEEQKSILASGHHFEALARPLAEAIIGEDLYPVVGKNGQYSASYDGLTMLENIAFEHKSMNDALREAMHEGCTGESLPLAYQVQMEQQCMVCQSIEKVLFMASSWKVNQETGEWEKQEERHCWYYPNLELRAEIEQGWMLLAQDVANYKPPCHEQEVVGQSPDLLPALRVEVHGGVTTSNLDSFKAVALRTLSEIKTELVTDKDFADAEKTVKWCSGVESALAAAKQHALSQTESIEALFRTIDEISEQTRSVRLKLEKLVKTEKEANKERIVMSAQRSLDEHIFELNRELGANYLQVEHGVFAPVVKGLKSLDSMSDKVKAELARKQAEANAKRDRFKANRQALNQDGADWFTLFPDFATVGAKEAEDFQALAMLRINTHKQAEAARIEAERARIRAEEEAKAKAAAAQAVAEEQERLRKEAKAKEDERAEAEYAAIEAMKSAARDMAEEARRKAMRETPLGLIITEEVRRSHDAANAPTLQPVTAVENKALSTQATLNVTAINARLSPISLTAGGIAELGIEATHEGKRILYSEADYQKICTALVSHIQQARTAKQAAA